MELAEARERGRFNYSEKALPEAIELERKLYEFFLNIKAKIRNSNIDKSQKWNDNDKLLYFVYTKVQSSIHDSLCDNFDTPRAMRSIFELVSATNRYIQGDSDVKVTLIEKMDVYIRHI